MRYGGGFEDCGAGGSIEIFKASEGRGDGTRKTFADFGNFAGVLVLANDLWPTAYASALRVKEVGLGYEDFA